MIFITGAARSGTTLTCSILSACGAEFGQVNSLMEHTPFREGFVKPLLERAGYDPLCQYPLPDTYDLSWTDSDIDSIRLYLHGLNFYKGAKLIFLWKMMSAAFPDAKWIIVRRSKQAIADSCRRTRFMRKRTDWESWVDSHLEQIQVMKLTLNCQEIWTDDLDLSEFKKAVDFSGLQWDHEAAKRQIDPGKMRSPQ